MLEFVNSIFKFFSITFIKLNTSGFILYAENIVKYLSTASQVIFIAISFVNDVTILFSLFLFCTPIKERSLLTPLCNTISSKDINGISFVSGFILPTIAMVFLSIDVRCIMSLS